MGMEGFNAPPPQEDLEERREEALSKGQILHEDAVAAQEEFIAEARKNVEMWDKYITEYKAKIEEYKTAEEDADGEILTDKEYGTKATRKEAIAGMERLIREAEIEREKEEAKFMSRL